MHKNVCLNIEDIESLWSTYIYIHAYKKEHCVYLCKTNTHMRVQCMYMHIHRYAQTLSFYTCTTNIE